MPETNFTLTMVKLTRRWLCDASGDEPSYSRSLSAAAVVRGGLNAVGETSDVPSSRVHCVQVELGAVRLGEGESASCRANMGQAFIHRASNSLLSEAILTLQLSEQDFKHLWDMTMQPLTLSIWAEWNEEAGRLVLPVKSYGVSDARLRIVRLELKAEAGSAEEVYAARARDVMQAFEPHYCRQSQVQSILSELAEGLSHIEDLEERSDRTHDAIELICHARRAFREELSGTGRPYYDNAYSLPKAEFLAYLEQYDDAKQNLLKERYDRIWVHYKLSEAIQLGQAKAGPARDEARCFAEEIEPLAHEYLAMRGVESKTLEWLLMDSLVYSECLGFAQLVTSTESHFGLPVPTQLQPKSAGKKAVEELKLWLLKAGGELLKLIVTYVVAHTVTGGDALATWVVVTGASAARWVVGALRAGAASPKVKLHALLGEMTLVSEYFGRLDFNPRNVRQHIHTLAHKGVSFSPLVLTLLDRQIEEGRP